MPSVFGPQWHETVQPACVSSTVSNDPYCAASSFAAATTFASAAAWVMNASSGDVLAPVKALFYILADALFKRAAVLLAHGHLAVSHLDAGLQVREDSAAQRNATEQRPFM